MAAELGDLSAFMAVARTGGFRDAARALGVQRDRGTLEAGKLADLAVWDVEHPAELAYALGANPCHAVYKRGRRVVAAANDESHGARPSA